MDTACANPGRKSLKKAHRDAFLPMEMRWGGKHNAPQGKGASPLPLLSNMTAILKTHIWIPPPTPKQKEHAKPSV